MKFLGVEPVVSESQSPVRADVRTVACARHVAGRYVPRAAAANADDW
jgi:hypothetical protein